MKRFLTIVHQNLFFYGLNSSLFLVLICSLFFLDKGQSFIWLNQIHTKTLTFFLEIMTFFGDGLFVIIVSVLLMVFVKSYRKLGFIILVGYLSSGIFCQIIKNITQLPRPFTYFELQKSNFYIDTFANCRKGFKSFPSGHTASFFALATSLANCFKQKSIGFVLFVLSVLIGYSRIYLGHHFLMDATFGAIIGVFFAVFSEIWVENWSKNLSLMTKLNKMTGHKFNFINADATKN